MQKIFILLFLISACSTTPKKADAGKVPISKPFLFTATKGFRRWYIFGTFHHSVSASELPNSVFDAIRNSQIAIFETAKLNDDRPVPSYYHHSAKEKPLLPETVLAFKERGVKPGLIDFASRGALCRLYANGFIDHSIEAMDLTLLTLAQIQNKYLVSLDDPILIEKFTSDDLETCDPDEFVKIISPAMAKGSDGLEEALYRTGDVAQFSEGFNFTRPILKDRNALWIKKLREIKADHVFVAVGIGHLPSETGILNLLANEGYKIQQVDF